MTKTYPTYLNPIREWLLKGECRLSLPTPYLCANLFLWLLCPLDAMATFYSIEAQELETAAYPLLE